MKICLVHEEYPEETNFGGIATYQKNIAEEYVKMGHEVYVICRGLKENKTYIENGVNITRIFVEKTDNQIEDYTEYRKRVSNLLCELQDSNKIEIIEVPDWGAETVLFEPSRKIPLIVRLHTPLKVWLKFNQNNFGNVTDLMLQWEEKMLKAADFITCCSNALRKIIVNEFNIPTDEICVTPNPANIDNFYRDDSISKENSIVFIGSLEERKGVIVLAHALNLFFQRFPNVKMKFIGKDTDRNNKNISTIEYIKQIVDKKYHSNIEFLGQLQNSNLNAYINSTKMAIFPSLFDNFPYVVLETMLTGTHIVGSRNSGMTEMLDDETSIYETGNYENLAQTMIRKYNLSNIEQISTRNIVRAKTLYNSSYVCTKMIDIYKTVIEDFNSKKIEKGIIKNVLEMADINDNIKDCFIEKGGVANIVFKVITDRNVYIVKRYLYDYDFNLSKELYNRYEQNNIKVVKPINNEPIHYQNHVYNIFKYYKHDNTMPEVNIEYLFNIINTNREINYNSYSLIEKCDTYYEKLLKTEYNKSELYSEICYVNYLYEKIKNDKLFQEKFLNHGDLSKDNIIMSENKPYIIDFDETTVCSFLYDYAVIVVKQFVEENRLDYEKTEELKNMIMKKHKEYRDIDFINIIEFYLLKILMEKFYLHETGKISLYAPRQQKDSYTKYYKLLIDINEYKNHKLHEEMS